MKRFLSVICIFSILMAVGYPVYASENAYNKSEIAAETASRTTLEK